MFLWALLALTIFAQSHRASLALPLSAPWAISPCPSDATAGTTSSSPQSYPAWPWVLLSWSHLQAQILVQPQAIFLSSELADARSCSCSWLGQWARVWLQDLPWLLRWNPWHSLRATGSCWYLCCPGRILVYGHMKINSSLFTFCYCLSKKYFHYQLWWGHTWNCVSSTRYMDIPERIKWQAMKGLEPVTSEERLRELGLVSLEKRRLREGTLPICTNIGWQAAKSTQPDSSELWPVTDQRQWVQTETDKVPPEHKRTIFFYWECYWVLVEAAQRGCSFLEVLKSHLDTVLDKQL